MLLLAPKLGGGPPPDGGGDISPTEIAFQIATDLGVQSSGGWGTTYTKVSPADVNAGIIFIKKGCPYDDAMNQITFNGVATRKIGRCTVSGGWGVFVFFAAVGNLPPGDYPVSGSANYSSGQENVFALEYTGVLQDQANAIDGLNYFDAGYSGSSTVAVNTTVDGNWVFWMDYPPSTFTGSSPACPPYAIRPGGGGSTFIDTDAAMPPGSYGTTYYWAAASWVAMMGFGLRHA
jgi:hypothetical protein